MKNDNNDFSEYFKKLEKIINECPFGFFEDPSLFFPDDKNKPKPFGVSDNNNPPNSPTCE